MRRYYSEGGCSNPNFINKVRVTNVNDEMFHWCSTYPSERPFERWYVEWKDDGAIFQFETEKPAVLFGLKFGDN